MPSPGNQPPAAARARAARWIPLATAAIAMAALMIRAPWKGHSPIHPDAALSPPVETVPPGIIVTESASPAPAPGPPGQSATSPGDTLLAGYADPSRPEREDLVLLARALGNFLLVEKSAANRPLSANEEWSAALLGRRGGQPWLTCRPPVFHPDGKLLDRHGHLLHFHALGHGQWEIRSPGPDGRPHTTDDITVSMPPK